MFLIDSKLLPFHLQSFTVSCGSYLIDCLWQRVLPCTGCGTTCRMLTGASGSLSDGSGTSNYANNARCQWIIAPKGATQITLTFTELSTHSSADFVQVWQCANTDCQTVQQLAHLHGFHSSQYTVTSGLGVLLVQFVTDTSGNSPGFTATWSSNAQIPFSSNVSSLPILCKFWPSAHAYGI
jgi:hypothetical protein